MVTAPTAVMVPPSTIIRSMPTRFARSANGSPSFPRGTTFRIAFLTASYLAFEMRVGFLPAVGVRHTTLSSPLPIRAT